MITEKDFLRSHRGFWRTLLPMSEHYIRERNSSLDQYLTPLSTQMPPDGRGVVNEVAFLLFVEAVRTSLRDARALSPDVVTLCIDRALGHVKTMRAFNRRTPRKPTAAEVDEAFALANRTLLFFLHIEMAPTETLPAFPGCGWLNECHGDVLAGGLLVECKAGDRRFLSMDLEQALIYAALNFAAKNHDIDQIALVNPRLGCFFVRPVEELCQRLAGRNAVEVLSDIVDYVSEPTSRYGA